MDADLALVFEERDTVVEELETEIGVFGGEEAFRMRVPPPVIGF